MGAADSTDIKVMSGRERTIEASDLRALFQQAEWTRERDDRSIASMLSGTSVCVAAWQSERLIGYARAISDGTFRAFIEDVIVEANERGGGLGYKLIGRLFKELEGIQEIKLFCVPDLVPFYGKLGFVPTELVGMERRRYPANPTNSADWS